MSSFLLRRSLPQAARAFSTSSARPSFAKITLVGRLADSPEEVRHTSNGQVLVKYAVATSSGRGDNQKTSWFKVTSFLNEGPQKDFITGLEKGTLVYVEGEASNAVVEDDQGGKKTFLNIVQQKLEVLQKKQQQEQSAPQ